MPLTNASEVVSGLQEWSEPLVYDRLSAAYRSFLKDDALAHRLARLHAPVWRALIAGDTVAFEAMRAILVSALGSVRLSRAHLARIDAEIVSELAEVVEQRFSRSPRTATAYRLALAELARRLRPVVRAAAAA